MATLSEKQIQEIDRFVKSKYVDYYDIQIELVDHLASEIERLSEETPSIPFEQALSGVYKSFGIFGFDDIVNEKLKASYRAFHRIQVKSLRRLFRMPDLLISLLALGFLIQCHRVFSFDWLFGIVSAISVTMAVAGGYRLYKIRSSKGFKLSCFKSYSLYQSLVVAVVYLNLYVGQMLSYWGGSWASVWYLSLAWITWIWWWASYRAAYDLFCEQKTRYPMAFS